MKSLVDQAKLATRGLKLTLQLLSQPTLPPDMSPI